MIRKITPFALLVLFAIALSITGTTLPAGPIDEVAISVQSEDSQPLGLVSPTEVLSCRPEGAAIAGFKYPPFSCKCWQGCCINDACWSGLFLQFCGPN